MDSKGSEWQVKWNGDVHAYGPMSTFPTPAQRKVMLSAGYKIYVDGRIYGKSEKNA